MTERPSLLSQTFGSVWKGFSLDSDAIIKTCQSQQNMITMVILLCFLCGEFGNYSVKLWRLMATWPQCLSYCTWLWVPSVPRSEEGQLPGFGRLARPKITFRAHWILDIHNRSFTISIYNHKDRDDALVIWKSNEGTVLNCIKAS